MQKGFLLPHDTWRIQVGKNISNVFRQSKQFGKEKKNKERKSPKYGSQKSGFDFYHNS